MRVGLQYYPTTYWVQRKKKTVSFTTGWSDSQHLAKWSSLAVPTAIRVVKHDVAWYDAGVNRQYTLCGILARNVCPHVYHDKKVTWIKKVEHYMGIFKWFDAIKNRGKYYRLNNQLQCMNLDSGSWIMEERSQLRNSVYRKYDEIVNWCGRSWVQQQWYRCVGGWPNSWEMLKYVGVKCLDATELKGFGVACSIQEWDVVVIR